MRRLSSGFATAWMVLALAALPVVASPDPDSNAPADPNVAPGDETAAPASPEPEAPPAAPAPAPHAPKITRIQIDGNQRLTTDAVLHIMSTRVGDPFDEEALRKDFKKIWDRGLLQDLSLESRDDKGGVAIIVHVREKPVVNNVSYDESKVVGESQIEDALKERKATIAIGEPVNLDAIKKAEEGIKSVLGQKGYLDAEVVSEMKPAESAGAMDIHFKIKEGPRTRIRKIEFTGNTVFSDHRLKKTLKLTREHGWFTKMSGKDTYHPLKLDQDMREVESLYHNDGYIEVELKAPVVTVVEEKTSTKPGKGRKWVHIVQPIEEGKQYRVGTVEVNGNSVFTAEQIRKRIPLRQGDILNNGLLQLGLDAIEADYGRKGYFYISTNRVINRKADGTADIVVKVSEDKPYKIDKIEFVGNTVTRDNVLRREMSVSEEDLLDIQKVRLGLRRINQLGFFEIQKEPVIKPVEGTDKVSVTVEGIEQRRSELQVGGGYSGLDGGFFTSSYQTRNFLGRGDVVSFNAQIGHISTRYVVSYTEPFFLGRPLIFGFSLFKTNSNFTDFNTTASGGSLTLGKRFMTFHSVSAAYQLQDTNFSPVTGITSQTTTSSIRPVYQYDTRNNFFRPSRGVLFFASVEYAGGTLGGDNNFIRPSFEVTKYVKSWHRTFWALHAGAGYVAPFGGDVLPTFDRFFLGGERTLRLFETRTVAPDAFVSRFFPAEIFLDKADCPPAPAGSHHNTQKRCNIFRYGGNKMVIFNVEYVIPSSGPVDFALFLDAGNVYTENHNIDLQDLRKDAGVELRFFLPVFGAPLRLIYGWNLDPHPHERSKNFVFSIGTTF
ncbi:MAG: outer membrane protein assembly factor BamA [Acidobacteria bacterium]|nr:outer membrane protein assembly factor BamA [Acidobacteriota bacterium]